MSVQKRLSSLNNRIINAKHLFEVFKGSKELIDECDEIIIEIESIPLLSKNIQKCQLKLNEIILRSEDVLSEITREHWKMYKNHLKAVEKEKEERRLELVQKEDSVRNQVQNSIDKHNLNLFNN